MKDQHSESEDVHRRFNPLTGKWVLVSPHRSNRPWQGAQEKVDVSRGVNHDADCYLCPGNARVTGEFNPKYESTFVFSNDFAALKESELVSNAASAESDPYFQTQAASGHCRVMCFSPDHGLTLAEMCEADIAQVVRMWIDQAAELGARYKWVQLFENKGEAMGCSNPHPHGQVWASDFLPHEIAEEDRRLRDLRVKHGENFLLGYALKESEVGERVVFETEQWIAVVPYWAAWPFETLLLPKFDIARITDLEADDISDLSRCLKGLLVRYDNLFQCIFPYSMGWHFAPFDADSTEHWQLHAHFYPPLLRSASVKKFMVGYELLAESQRDLTPEQAAARLRESGDEHFRSKSGS